MVRNLLVIGPFLAVCVARGAAVVDTVLAKGMESWGWRRGGVNYVRAAWVMLLGSAVLFNAWWLDSSAESIVARRTDMLFGMPRNTFDGVPVSSFFLRHG